jgi:predicted RecB family nuclease
LGTQSIDKIDKLSLMFIGHVLALVQKKPPVLGRIVSVDGKTHQIKLEGHHKTIRSLLEPLQEWIAEPLPEEPPVILNKHCPICQFRALCEAKAIQEDNLSRLDSVTAKLVREYEKKGIFTVKQLSYVFKPRKRKKRAKNPPLPIHEIELQALAIRTGKIYLQELPTVEPQEIELYLDIEGVPDQNLNYLIGVLVRQGEISSYYPFWADDLKDESTIWQALVTMINQYPDAPIYHYGSYEARAISKLARRYETDSKNLTKHLVNINKQIYGKVYFPVYSNRLKEIADFVGASWTTTGASGLQSLVWRYYWDETHHTQYKTLLLTYNEEDCHALKLLVDELVKIKQSADTLPEVNFANKFKEQITGVGQQVCSQFKTILRLAHFNYDKKKISFRQGEEKESKKRDLELQRKAAKQKQQKLLNIRRSAKKIVQIPFEEVCPKCGHKPLKQTTLTSKRFIVDLISTRDGIRKTITQYVGNQGYCRNCKGYSAPPGISKYSFNQAYGHSFGAWVVYQRVALRLPYESIVEALLEYFNEKITISQPQRFLKQFARYYLNTEKLIIEHILKSPFVHVDETKVNIQGANWYVWVFTNEKYVVFKLRETREATVVHEFLSGYSGILISDFYPGYDSIECKQQKCWVHLIRDLNDDLRNNPFDKEFEVFILEVRNLIVPIIGAVQKYGLRKQILTKFAKHVNKFYQKAIIDKRYKSDLVLKYQKDLSDIEIVCLLSLRKTGYPGIIIQPRERSDLSQYKEKYPGVLFKNPSPTII